MGAFDKKRIGIRYCGGCNPHYDRVEMIQRAFLSLQNRFVFLKHDQEKIDGLILVNGCPRSCAAADPDQGEVPLYSVIHESALEPLIDWLTGLDGMDKVSASRPYR